MYMARKEDKLPTLTISFQDLLERSELLLGEAETTHGGELRPTSVRDTSSKTKPEKDKVHTGGLLYLSPTKDPPKASADDAGEDRVRRTKGSTHSQASSSQRRLFHASGQEDATSRRHKTAQNHDTASPVKKDGQTSERSIKSSSCQKGPDITSPHRQTESQHQGTRVVRTDGANPRRESRKSERMSKETEARKLGKTKTDKNKQTNAEDAMSDETADDVLRKEWSRHEARKVERTLSKWSGDLAKLKPVIQTW